MQSATISAEEQERLPLLGSAVSDPIPKSSTLPQRTELVYRRARLSDAKAMSYVATQAYMNASFSDFLSPGRHKFYADWAYGYEHRYKLHILSAHKICSIAVDPLTNQIVAAGIFSREGEGAKALIKEQRSLWKTVLLWWLPIQFKIVRWFWPDRSANLENEAKFLVHVSEQDKFWGKWPERWHCRSFTVLPSYQRRGIGSKILGEIQEKCRKEGVPLALEASPAGEPMYRARGFKLMERFSMSLPGEEDNGGLMMYDPST